MNRHTLRNGKSHQRCVCVCVCVHQAHTWALTHSGTSKHSGMPAKMAGSDVGRINSGRRSDLCSPGEGISTGRWKRTQEQ